MSPVEAQSSTARSEPPLEVALCRGVIHAALEAIVMVDEDHRIVMINPAALRMFGCSEAEVLGSDLSRFLPARFRATHAGLVQRFGASGIRELPMGQRGTVVGLRADGQEFPAEATISRLEVAQGSAARRYYTALLRDVSKEQDLEADMAALKQRMRTVFDLTPVAICITEDERIVFANRASAALFGTPDGESLVGRSIYALLRPQAHAAVRHKVAQALATDSPVPTLSERIARGDGSERDVVIGIAGLPDHARNAVQIVFNDITERVNERQELERSRRELRRLSANLVDAREEERRRIARELHDELGQRLTALKMELASLAGPLKAAPGDERIAAMLDMVDETVASVRRIATDLRPLMLDDLGLNAAIEWLGQVWAQRMGVAVKLRLGKTDPPIGEAATITLYRMVQEALTNVARHAHATEVRIEMKQQAGALVLTVQDNGVGFGEPSLHQDGSHGLMGIRERAYMLGGQLEIGNSSGGGGRIAVRLPLSHGGTSLERWADRRKTGR